MIDTIEYKTVRALLKQHKLRPNKVMGQHFLIDKHIRDTIIEEIEVKANNTVLEVGPGAGVLTIEIAKQFNNVVAVEKDAFMVTILNDLLAKNSIENVTIVTDDILRYLLTSDNIIDIVVGALPYYLTSRFFRVLLEKSPLQWKKGVFIIQNEVAERIIATPPSMNLLTLSVQLFANPSIVTTIPPSSFWPQPNVGSALLALEPKIKNSKSKIINATILKLAKQAFQNKRKQLKNTLPIELLNVAKIDPMARPQHLSINDWKTLAKNA